MKLKAILGMTTASLGFLLLALLALNGKHLGGGEDSNQTGYSVQLVRADNEEHPADHSLRPVPEGLRALLAGAFRWQQYWEVSRRHVPVQKGDLTKVRLSSQCEVEIELISPGERETRIYINGVLSSRSRVKVQRNAAPEISGGDLEDGSAWFVVVEDEPDEEEALSKLSLRRD